MFRKLTLLAVTLATGAGALAPAAVDAQRYRGDDRGYYAQGYDQRAYRGDDGYARYRPVKRCSDGTAGAIIGAIAGGLLGRTIDTRSDRSIGTLLGAGGGALAGRAIERNGSKQASYEGRCYR